MAPPSRASNTNFNPGSWRLDHTFKSNGLENFSPAWGDLFLVHSCRCMSLLTGTQQRGFCCLHGREKSWLLLRQHLGFVSCQVRPTHPTRAERYGFKTSCMTQDSSVIGGNFHLCELDCQSSIVCLSGLEHKGPVLCWCFYFGGCTSLWGHLC
jgi:hypothetical protein